MERLPVSAPAARDPESSRARERRALHVEGLVAVLATLALATAAELGLSLAALSPAVALYLALTASWVHRYLALLGSDCPRCGALFFFSLERLLYSLPYLAPRCAHCDEPIEPKERRGR